MVKDDRDMLGAILDLRELDVSDVMVHRTRMLSLNADLPVNELIAAALESPFTRIPLYRETQDNIVGVVHIKDLLRALHNANGDPGRVNLSEIALKPWFVPDTTPVQAQMRAFLTQRKHFALVVGEYGEVQGLVTLEDILEEIVGDIADEHDPAFQPPVKQADGSYIVEGASPVRDINRALDLNLPEEEATTVAGLVISAIKAIPEPGQKAEFQGVTIEVREVANNRIVQLQIRQRSKAKRSGYQKPGAPDG